MINPGKLILATIIIGSLAFQVNAGNTDSSNQPAQRQNAVKSASGNFLWILISLVLIRIAAMAAYLFHQETGKRNIKV